MAREQTFVDDIKITTVELLPLEQKQYIKHWAEPKVSKSSLEHIYDYLHIKKNDQMAISEKEKILAQLYRRDVDNTGGKANPKFQKIKAILGNKIDNAFYQNAQYFRHDDSKRKQGDKWVEKSNDEKLEIMDKWFKQYLYVIGFL